MSVEQFGQVSNGMETSAPWDDLPTILQIERHFMSIQAFLFDILGDVLRRLAEATLLHWGSHEKDHYQSFPQQSFSLFRH